MSFINYSNIVGYVEAKINAINTLSANEAALVAAMANLLAGRNNPPSNMLALETYLQGKENLVTDADLVKDVTLLLGASLPSKNTVWRMREFLSSDNFTVPLNIAGGLVYVTGSGGGGSGAARVFAGSGVATISGANSGCYIERRPVQVTAGDIIPVVIGAGGASVSVTSATTTALAGNAGADSSFGTLIIQGGAGGSLAQNVFDDTRGGWIGGYLFGTAQILPAQNSIAYRAGRRVQSGLVTANGSAAGAFGNGVDGVTALDANATAAAAGDNTGAGGGGAVVERTTGTPTATSGAGGSGRIVVEWQEFV